MRQAAQFVQVLLPRLLAQLHIHELGTASDFDQAGTAEFLEVVGKRGGSNGELLLEHQAGCFGLAGGDAAQYLITPRIRQGFADTRK